MLLPSVCCGCILVNSKLAYSVGASLLSSRHKYKLPISHSSLNTECSKLIITISQKSPSIPADGSQWLRSLASAQAPSISSSSPPKSTQQPRQQGMHLSSSFSLLRLLLSKFRLPHLSLGSCNNLLNRPSLPVGSLSLTPGIFS